MKFLGVFFISIIISFGSSQAGFATPFPPDQPGYDFTCEGSGLEKGAGHVPFAAVPGPFYGLLGDQGLLNSFFCRRWANKVLWQPCIGNGYVGSILCNGELKIGQLKQPGPEQMFNPAPATFYLLGTGLIGLAAFRRKKGEYPSEERPSEKKTSLPDAVPSAQTRLGAMPIGSDSNFTAIDIIPPKVHAMADLDCIR